jgi:hypothetical protein
MNSPESTIAPSSSQARKPYEYPLAEKARAVIGLSPAERLVLGRYAHHANAKTMLAWPGLKSLGSETGLCRPHIVACRRKLEALGFLQLVSKGGGRISSVYRCNLQLINDKSALGFSGNLRSPQGLTETTQMNRVNESSEEKAKQYTSTGVDVLSVGHRDGSANDSREEADASPGLFSSPYAGWYDRA